MPNLKVAEPAAPTLLEGLVTDYLASCRARGLAPSTVNQAYAYSLQDVFLPWCARVGVERVDQLDQRALDRFTSGLLEDGGKRGKPLSKDTVHSYVRAVRQFLKWAAKEGEAVKGTPQLPRLTRRVLDMLSREEIERLEDAAPRGWRGSGGSTSWLRTTPSTQRRWWWGLRPTAASWCRV
jgi:site-specific recombinase XerD